MNNKQTAMQQLRDRLITIVNHNNSNLNAHGRAITYFATNILNDIDKNLLELEKEQIIDAYLTGLMHPLEMEATRQASKYYHDTYVLFKS